jgi:predicted nucleotidyltransferase
MTENATIDLDQRIFDRLNVFEEDIAEFCQKWKIVEFAVFGSVLRDDFRSDSDIDVLVTFDSNFCCKLSDQLAMQDQIEALFKRSVDLIQKNLLKNPYSRAEILRSCQVIYVRK